MKYKCTDLIATLDLLDLPADCPYLFLKRVNYSSVVMVMMVW
jgi:hypothetical protein